MSHSQHLFIGFQKTYVYEEAASCLCLTKYWYDVLVDCLFFHSFLRFFMFAIAKVKRVYELYVRKRKKSLFF